jgi:hypothetical protein
LQKWNADMDVLLQLPERRSLHNGEALRHLPLRQGASKEHVWTMTARELAELTSDTVNAVVVMSEAFLAGARDERLLEHARTSLERYEAACASVNEDVTGDIHALRRAAATASRLRQLLTGRVIAADAEGELAQLVTEFMAALGGAVEARGSV